MHRAKGLEFKAVLLLACTAKLAPIPRRPSASRPAGPRASRRRERSLLYVAMTRARDELRLTWSPRSQPLPRRPAGNPRMKFSVGSLVRARGREWVVLPESEPEDTLVLRPLGGTDDEDAGIYTRLERRPVRRVAELRPPGSQPSSSATTAPAPSSATPCASASAPRRPFRSLARIAVEPRPYQLVPLLMALARTRCACSSPTTSASARPSRPA
jgi:hypothetical protein